MTADICYSYAVSTCFEALLLIRCICERIHIGRTCLLSCVQQNRKKNPNKQCLSWNFEEGKSHSKPCITRWKFFKKPKHWCWKCVTNPATKPRYRDVRGCHVCRGPCARQHHIHASLQTPPGTLYAWAAGVCAHWRVLLALQTQSGRWQVTANAA